MEVGNVLGAVVAVVAVVDCEDLGCKSWTDPFVVFSWGCQIGRKNLDYT